jgi:HAD superfamily hydrolase (TIGR01549 family)
MSSTTDIELVLFDLDETIVPTTTLLMARHSKVPRTLRDLGEYDGIQPHPGIARAIADVAASRRVGLVTSSPTWYVDQLLGHHLPEIDFAVVVTYDDVENIKPHPEPLLLAVARAKARPETALYVGDDIADQQACAAAGIRFVGAGWAQRPTFESSAQFVERPSELLAVIGGAGW